jgi:hypothetical protein
MLPWLAFSEAAGRAACVILEHRNFVKKLVFPLEILPVNLGAAGLVTELFALAIFAIGLLVARGGVPLSVLWLPVLLIPQFGPLLVPGRTGERPGVDPPRPSSGKHRVLRRGSWDGGPGGLRASVRSRGGPGGRCSGLGFRCVREVIA